MLDLLSKPRRAKASEGSSLGQQLPILTLESGARFQSLRADSMASSLIIFLVSA
jgi:hypothetical protein